MALSLLCRFVFEAKGKTHRGISLIFTRSEAPVGHFSELSWLFLLSEEFVLQSSFLFSRKRQ